MQNKTQNSKIVWAIIISFLVIPIIVSVVSTIHVINFFELSNNFALAVTLAVAFEIGALSALAGLVALGKINKNVVWFIFILLTLFQINGNTYFAYDILSTKMIDNPNLIRNWAELFGLAEEDPVFIKRIIALISGGILPIVSLAFLDLLVDYIRKTFGIEENKKEIEEKEEESPKEENPKIEEEANQIENNQEEKEKEEEKKEEESPIDLDQENEEHDPQDIGEEDFQKMLDEKKKRLDKMKQPNMEMLAILYDEGRINPGEELPSYNEFMSKIEPGKYFQKEINLFLTLCNYLEIFKVSNTQKIALKSYEEAKETLSNYLTLN